ncbi:acyl-CoA dehydrogenase family protein [Streptomyces montanisoli]|uniref:Acyl-CoA/acyl-ACP dehydrogenase n=1 Tax=Streptomyces montanisoli TaxID=2798581 RepID=A0A940MDV0_9ACTN|nr:acyl-CoA dehydrogenase family protein [Streptomyces montanisoli]MBP0456873.1 acyl-CoA/acyl-ACP dehydrogenase [Streptomyces montanisoli]
MSSSQPSAAPFPSPLHELYQGCVPWRRLRSFPEPTAAEHARGDETIAELEALLREHTDPEEIERTGRLPDTLTEALRKGGFLGLMAGADLGGLGLSPHNAFRVIQAAAGWSIPIAFSLAITNGFGSGTYLPLLSEGPLKDMITERTRGGIVSAGADAEPIGTANEHRATTAVPTEDGTGYEITGEKVFIGNGTQAELMDVSATLRHPDGSEEVRLFFVDSSMDGFEVAGQHEFMGLHGATIGNLRLDRVRVPAHHLMPQGEDGWRMRPGERDTAHARPAPDAEAEEDLFRPTDLGQLAALGRILVIAPPALATARLCLRWSRDFTSRRIIDGRGLGTYEEIQRQVAETAADVFTIDTVMTWALKAHRTGDSRPELTAAKNLTSTACWRAIDRTVSLLGAEGYETAASKARRGARPLPVERYFRDARALRVAGGVDFMVDRWSAETALHTCWYENPTPAPAGHTEADARQSATEAPELSTACQEHLSAVQDQARRLAATCHELTGRHTMSDLFAQQRLTATLGRIGNELLAMSLVLARAAAMAADGDPQGLPLADLACTSARHRLAALWPELAHATANGPGTPHAGTVTDTAATCLHGPGPGPDLLLADLFSEPTRPAPHGEHNH